MIAVRIFHEKLRRTSAGTLALQLTATVAAVSGCVAGVPDAGPAVPAGKSGTGFYTVDQAAVTGAPGTLLQAQRVAPETVEGATTWRVLYVSRDGVGQPIAVSGTVSVPEGPAPEAGWPVLSYGHGTTGVADRCAPSRATLGQEPMGSTALGSRVPREFVTDGFVVAQSDYEGLGTP